MTVSPKTIRIAVALVISICFIVAGYFLSTPLRLTIANAGSTEALLKAYAAKDTDADGLPDWQESLYGTDVANAHSVDKTLTDKEAVDKGLVQPKFKSETASSTASDSITDASFDGTSAPKSGSLTEKFALEFFNNFLLSKKAGVNPSAEEMQAFVEGAVAELEAGAQNNDAFSEKDIVVSGSGPAALTTYATNVSNVLRKNNPDTTENELEYLYDAVVENDSVALTKVATIAKAYLTIAQGLKQVAAPQEAAAAHLQLMNAVAHIGESIENMAAFDKDPIRTFLGIDQYATVAVNLARALAAVDVIFKDSGVVLQQENPGFYFYNLIEQAGNISSSSDAQTP